MTKEFISRKTAGNFQKPTSQFAPRPFATTPFVTTQRKPVAQAENSMPQNIQRAPERSDRLSRIAITQPEPFTPQLTVQRAEQAELANQNPGNETEKIQRSSKGNNRLEKMSILPPEPPSTPSFPIQAKLTVGAAGDKYEQEADRVARQVVNGIHSPFKASRNESGSVQRKISIQAFGGEGGEVSSDWEGQLSQARGGGQPLSPFVREPMEREFGADFSGVRVHTGAQADNLARSIQAKAFTTGQDVFFGQGTYQPESRGGQELIAHELTHVVQQGGGSNTIQRAVGFEFETNYKVERKNTGLKGVFKPYRALSKTELIKAYPQGFRMEADENSTLGSTIEFVIDPPIAENAPNKLESILQRLDGLASDLSLAQANIPVDLDTLTNDPAHSNIRITPKGNQGLIANPQVTGGVSFDKLLTLLNEIGNGSTNAPFQHKNAAAQLERMAPHMPKQAAIRGASVLGTAQFKGLIAFITSYIQFGQKAQPNYPPLNYTKLISNSILLRTDLGSMFMKLDPEEREEYQRDPDRFIFIVLATANLTNPSPDVPVLERGVRKGQTPGTKDYTRLLNNAATQLTRRQWLTQITQGVDLLSSHHVPALQSQLEGLGALGPTTDPIGPQPNNPLGARDRGQGIVMEFRNMRKNVPWTQWHTLASGIFDYIIDLNQR